MRVLFSAETPLSLTSFQSVITELARRGHEVTIAIHERARGRLARQPARGGRRQPA